MGAERAFTAGARARKRDAVDLADVRRIRVHVIRRRPAQPPQEWPSASRRSSVMTGSVRARSTGHRCISLRLPSARFPKLSGQAHRQPASFKQKQRTSSSLLFPRNAHKARRQDGRVGERTRTSSLFVSADAAHRNGGGRRFGASLATAEAELCGDIGFAFRFLDFSAETTGFGFDSAAALHLAPIGLSWFSMESSATCICFVFTLWLGR